MADQLAVYLAVDHVGELQRMRGGRVEFEYAHDWQARRDAYPLSLSLPLAARRHAASVVEPYLWGLLPDNEFILEAWARRFQVSSRNAFSLLAHVGADCPGAVQILLPERRHNEGTDQLNWLTEADIATRLRALRSDVSAWRVGTDTGQFSLAGAQPKTALWFDGQRWAVPAGATPTTHILKPGILDLDGSAHNEHFCLSVARELGLPTANSSIRQFDGQVAIVLERFDRRFTPSGVKRIHQEDFCQALAIHPSKKYQNDGGPSARAMVALLRESSTQSSTDVDTLLAALVFNWLIGGTDAHAKNYSLLIGTQGRSRLAPLYDLASALPYPDMPFQKLKLAMKVGDKYRLRDIGRHQWEKLAKELSLDTAQVLSVARRLAQLLPDASSTTLTRAQGEGAQSSLLPQLHAALANRGAECSKLLGD
jgi:serine/threonine-protein kinase HipA